MPLLLVMPSSNTVLLQFSTTSVDAFLQLRDSFVLFISYRSFNLHNFAYFREKCIISLLSLFKAFLKFLISFNSGIFNAKRGLWHLEVFFYLVSNLYQNYMMLWSHTCSHFLPLHHLNPTDYINIFIVSTLPCFPSLPNNLKFNLKRLCHGSPVHFV